MGRVNDISGQLFGELLVLYEVGRNKHGRVIWLCECSCREEIKVASDYLISGIKKHCGCKRKKRKSITKIDGKRTRTFRSWEEMKRRCYNTSAHNYRLYGARNIEVCDRWKNSFKNFLEDMGECPPGHTIDRIDNNGNYCVENCHWASYHEQSRNMRTNVCLEYNGIRLIQKDWAGLLKTSNSTVHRRLKKGESSAEIIEYFLRKNGIILPGVKNEEVNFRGGLSVAML